MASEAQIEANRRNSQSSTGPRTESGKEASSRNRLTYGLYTHEDYVKPGEAEIYAEFCKTMHDSLRPGNLLEETFVFEITGASWRLRRCAAAEADLADFREEDPFLDDATDKTRRSIERARAAAHSVINRSINQLRKLQTARTIREKLDSGAAGTPAGEVLKVIVGQKAGARERERVAQSVEKMPFPPRSSELASNCNAEGHAAHAASAEASGTPQIARNAQCPCKSGEKYKRCCGKNAPPVLGKAA